MSDGKVYSGDSAAGVPVETIEVASRVADTGMSPDDFIEHPCGGVCKRCGGDKKLHVVVPPEVSGFDHPVENVHPKRPCPACAFDGSESDQSDGPYYAKGLNVMEKRPGGDKPVIAVAYRSEAEPAAALLNNLASTSPPVRALRGAAVEVLRLMDTSTHLAPDWLSQMMTAKHLLAAAVAATRAEAEKGGES
jgi:hypothetical protein